MPTTRAVEAPDGEVCGADRTSGVGGMVVVGGGTVVVVVEGGTVVVVGTSAGGGTGDSSVRDGSVVVGIGTTVDSGTIGDVAVEDGVVVSGTIALGALRAAAAVPPQRALAAKPRSRPLFMVMFTVGLGCENPVPDLVRIDAV